MLWRTMLALLLCAGTTAVGQTPAAITSSPSEPSRAGGKPGTPHSAISLYRRLRAPGLDPARLYRIRDAHLDREDLHLTFDSGVIGFTYAIDGRVTGAYFQGEGEILLSPPDRVERASLDRFTGAAILDEIFTSASLRFNDDTLAELEPDLRPFQPISSPEAASEASAKGNPRQTGSPARADVARAGVETGSPARADVAQAGVEPESQESAVDDDLDEEAPGDVVDGPAFLRRGSSVLAALSSTSALRLLVTFAGAETKLPDGSFRWSQPPDDRYLNARLAGRKLGVFDVFVDSHMPEQIVVAQSNSLQYYNVWTSFPMRSVRARVAAKREEAPTSTDQTQTAAEQVAVPARISRCAIRAQIRPPHSLQAEATLDLQVSEGGNRLLLLELSRFLRVKAADANGVPLEWVQDEALESSSLGRHGNDVVAVVFPAPLAAGQAVRLHLTYGGDVLGEAGGGLMYVGARGTWYPNLGPAMSNFDMEFRYPAEWTLLATGKRAGPPAQVPGTAELTVRYVTERPIPFAGFNLGRYVKAETQAENVHIEGYAAHHVEDNLAPPAEVILPTLPLPTLPEIFPRRSPPEPGRFAKFPSPPRPSENVQRVTNNIAEDIRFLSERLGPFPYSELAVTQMPGTSSQSWPGLVYLSSLSFLSSEERAGLSGGSYDELTYSQVMPAHETAHQWWGNLLLWSSYREQWIVEALSNYCALLLLQKHDPDAFRMVLGRYRRDLARHNLEDESIAEAGPVTLGIRLNSSHFPDAYSIIAYERGTWLFHMLNTMLQDAQEPSSTGSRTPATDNGAANASHSSGATVQPAKTRDGESANDPFFAVLHTLRRRFEGQAVSTRDVQQVFEEVLPESLRYEGRSSLAWFFDGWVNGTALPVLALEDVRLTRHGSGLLATGRIVQKHAPADLVTSVPLYANIPGKDPVLLGRVFAEGRETPFSLPVPSQTRRILLDPFGTVLTRP